MDSDEKCQMIYAINFKVFSMILLMERDFGARRIKPRLLCFGITHSGGEKTSKKYKYFGKAN